MKVRCPNCRGWVKWEDNPCRPFCNERCKLADLGRWATGDYRIEEEEPGGTPPSIEKKET